MSLDHLSINACDIFSSYKPTLLQAVHANVLAAIREDLGEVDHTGLLIAENCQARANVLVRESAVLCGQPWFNEVFKQLDSSTHIQWYFAEGAVMPADAVVCTITGHARAMLNAERSALNFLQLLSGVATKVRSLLNLLSGTKARLLDTRKTIPGLRLAQKYAVRIGGGENQRLALYDGILIKENHIAAAGGIAPAIHAALALQAGVSIQIEVESLVELEQALSAGAQSILLDNFTVDQMHQAVALTAGRAVLEASGGVDHSSLRKIAETGVDRISIGDLTKNVKAIDYSMRFVVS